MKIVITSTGDQLSSKMDDRFGRAPWFCVHDTNTGENSFIANPFVDSMGGAGTKTSEMVAEIGAAKIISGHFGPKAKTVLEKFDIQLIETNELLTIEELIKKSTESL
ncbi:MAG TPA: NifB/NifX family molybdenum-iron cluster-binding protein [Prolixibacteraceae bacterium]|nr:NifB/NifX family molybdenum-iron cluster-binding protein [Prolixibacteraceae bacterium]